MDIQHPITTVMQCLKYDNFLIFPSLIPSISRAKVVIPTMTIVLGIKLTKKMASINGIILPKNTPRLIIS